MTELFSIESIEAEADLYGFSLEGYKRFLCSEERHWSSVVRYEYEHEKEILYTEYQCDWCGALSGDTQRISEEKYQKLQLELLIESVVCDDCGLFGHGPGTSDCPLEVL